jgi:hypothetical protein
MKICKCDEGTWQGQINRICDEFVPVQIPGEDIHRICEECLHDEACHKTTMIDVLRDMQHKGNSET